MRNLKTLRGLQDELAILHAVLAIGEGYDKLKRYDPKTYELLHRVLLANVRNVNARPPRRKGKR